MKLYYHPVSSYSQKVLMAFYEKGASFEPVLVNLMDPAGRAEYTKTNPLGKIPLLRVEEKDWGVPESSIIIEYIDRHCPGGTKLIPDDPELARQVRFRDRVWDLYVTSNVHKIFFDTHRPAGKNDPFGVEQAKKELETALTLIDTEMGKRKNTWALGETFSMADCAAAPALFYCRLLHPFAKHANVTAYANRLMERSSYQLVQKEAAPYLAAMQNK